MLIYGSESWELYLPFLTEEDSSGTCIGNKKIGQMSIVFKAQRLDSPESINLFPSALSHYGSPKTGNGSQLWFIINLSVVICISSLGMFTYM